VTDLPSSTGTFLFTDIEGSTAAPDRHNAMLDRAIAAHTAR